MSIVSTKEAAKLLNCSKRNVLHLVNAGKIKPINPNHNSFIFIKNEVEELAEKRNTRKEVQNA